MKKNDNNNNNNDSDHDDKIDVIIFLPPEIAIGLSQSVLEFHRKFVKLINNNGQNRFFFQISVRTSMI